MNKKTIQVLEYDKIIDMLRQQAGCEMAKEIISRFRPYTDMRRIPVAYLCD